MSEVRNEQVVRAIFDAQLDGDFERFISHWRDDAEYTFPGDNAVGKTYVGHDGMREFWERLGAKLPELGFAVDRVFVDGDEAAVEWHDWGTNEHGVSYESWGVTRMTLEDGKVRRARDMMDTQKLLGILGPRDGG
jgi:ketosteroid isomerase-like protein